MRVRGPKMKRLPLGESEVVVECQSKMNNLRRQTKQLRPKQTSRRQMKLPSQKAQTRNRRLQKIKPQTIRTCLTGRRGNCRTLAPTIKRMQEATDAGAATPGPEQDGPAADSAQEATPEPQPEVASEPRIAEQLHQSAPNLDLMLDLPLDVTVELGRAEVPLANVLGLRAGSVIQLDRLPGEPLDLLVNGQLVARGEIVVLNDTFAFRITDLIEP